MIIQIPPDYNFKENHRFLARSANECLHRIGEDYVEKVIAFQDQVYIFRITEGKNNLNVTFLLGTPDQAATAHIRSYIRDWLDLDTDMTAFYKMAAKDQILAPLVQRFKGLRLVGVPELFESLVWSVIGQQINLTFAYTLKRRVVERFGRAIIHNNTSYHVLPEPADILAHPVTELEVLKMTKRKAEYIYGVAKLLTTNELSKQHLQTLSLEEGIKDLIKIRGIGAWTANYVLMKCLRHKDAFPIADVGLHNGLKVALGLEAKPSVAEIEKLAENWKGWEAYATFYLWHSLL